MDIKGAITALVTPFKDGQFDEESYRRLIEWQIEQGINGLVPVGTTGESATLSHEEHAKVISVCVDQVGGRVPVIAGSGGNDTREAVELTHHAKEVGADATLQVTPYYNKPSQEGLVAHYKEIAKQAPLPMVLYNVPGRTSLNMLPSTVARLEKEVPEVIAVKEATGDMKQVSEVLEQCSPGFTVLSGDDFTVLPLMALGGRGVISVVSNIVPGTMASMCSAILSGDMDTARKLHYEMAPLYRAMFIETNPVPAKAALVKMGRISAGTRLPLVDLAQPNADKLDSILKEAGLV